MLPRRGKQTQGPEHSAIGSGIAIAPYPA